MTINQTNSSYAAFRRGPRFICFVLVVLSELTWPNAFATTEGESALVNSPLPHEKLGLGQELAKVHWVRLQGYFDGAKGHTSMLNELKEDVQSCVQAAHLAGRATRPPQIWPDYVQSNQTDTYDTVNRTITYSTTLLYTVNHVDCSLLENRRIVAKLASTKGFCQIDFINKKAYGVCDVRAHTDAPSRVHLGLQTSIPGDQVSATSAQMQATLAAMKKALKQFKSIKTGQHKTIAGIECEVLTHVLGTDGTACISRGGSFVGWHTAPESLESGMELELNAVGGWNAIALKARLDASVNAKVFTPYLADGFQIENHARRK